MNEIHWKPKAARQLRKLPQKAQTDITREVGNKLSVFPNCTGVKSLTNHEYDYRLRVGNYRVLFSFTSGGKVNIITIEEVKKRDGHTY